MIPFSISLNHRGSLGRELIKAVIGSAGVRFAGMAVTFLVGVQLARYLGPDGYGVYGTAMAITAILIVFAQQGLPQLITREVSGRVAQSDYAGAKGALVWFTASVAGVSTIILIIGLGGLYLWNSGSDRYVSRAFFWAMAIIPLFALTNLFASALRGFHMVVRAQVFDAVLRPLLFAIFLFAAFMLFGAMDATKALMLHATAAACILAICVFTLQKSLPEAVRSAPPTLHVRKWASSAVPMTATDIVRSVDGQYGVLLLGFLVSTHDVGIFRVAIAAAAFLALPGTIIALVIMPYVAKFHVERQTLKLQKLASISALAAFAITISMTAIFYFFGQAFIELTFGSSFITAWPLLMIISLSFTIQAYFGQNVIFLNMCGEEKVLLIAFLVALTIAVFASVLLIPNYGAIGVAVSMVLAEITRSLIMWRRAVNFLRIDTSVASIFLNITSQSQAVDNGKES